MVKKVSWTPAIWDDAVRHRNNGDSLRTTTAALKETWDDFSVSASQLHTEFKHLDNDPSYRPPVVLQTQPRQQQYHDNRYPNMLITTESARGTPAAMTSIVHAAGPGARGALTAPTTPVENARNQGQWPSQQPWQSAGVQGAYGQRRTSDNPMLLGSSSMRLPHRNMSSLNSSNIPAVDSPLIHQTHTAVPWRQHEYTPSSRSPSVVQSGMSWTEVDNSTNITAPSAFPMPGAGGQDMTLSLLRLIIRGGGVDQSDESGRPPLFHAMCSGRLDAVELLIDGGANIFADDDAGMDVISAADAARAAVDDATLAAAIRQCIDHVSACRSHMMRSSPRPSSFLEAYPIDGEERAQANMPDDNFFSTPNL